MIEFFDSRTKRLRHLVVDLAKSFSSAPRATFVTFSCSEDVLRFISFRKKLFSEIHLIADGTAMKKSRSSSLMSSKLFDSAVFSSVHAKFVLLESSEKSLLIVSSENLSRGNRFEVHLVTDDFSCCSNALDFISMLRRNGKNDFVC